MQDFNETKHNYTDAIQSSIGFAGQEHDFYTQVKADVLNDFAAQHFAGKPVALLDVGCGHGLIHRKLKGFTITGTDVAGEVLELAKAENPGATYLPYDGTTLPFPDASFDMTLAICVMHHVPVPDWDNFMREMRRVLKPGGVCAIIEHNPLNPVTRHIVNNCPLDEGVTMLRAGKLKALMKSAGFVRSGHEYILFTPFASRLMRALDRWLKWCPLGAQHVALGYVER